MLPLPQNLKLVWQRITFSKLTMFYFIFSILHCLIQVGFQTRAFMINSEAAEFLYSILSSTGAESAHEFPALAPDFSLRMCNTVPSNADPIAAGQCRVIWDGQSRDTNWIGSEPSQQPPAITSAATADPSVTSGLQNNIIVTPTASTSTVVVFVAPQPTAGSAAGAVADIIEELDEESDDEDEDEFDLDRRDEPVTVSGSLVTGTNQMNVTVSGMGFNDVSAVLDNDCLWALNYPVSILHNTKREDLVFIMFQVWVLGLSVVALLNESIPHILASLATHFLATGWATYQIFHTMKFQSDYKRVISEGACNGVALLTPYWKDRSTVEIPALALNGLGLLISVFLTYKLFKLFGWQTFKRVGASLTINRLYKVVLTLSITIQLAAFFIIVTVSLWLDQLFNTNLGKQATFAIGYKAASIAILIIVVPWLALGWLSIRREWKIRMFLFLSLAIIYLAGWAAMFFSWTFRWEFMTWTFFAVMSTISVALTFASLALGMVSRFNFGKGLPRFLAAQEELPGDDFQSSGPEVSDPEKVSFPTNGPIPTFSAAFGSGDQVPVPTKMFPARQAGPRFFRSAEPFETSSADRTMTSQPSLHRTNSNASQSSIGSYYSYSGKSETTTTAAKNNNRWVIE